jgi:hypothetical protein
MQRREKEKLLEEIRQLLAYGGEAPEIDPALLEYLDEGTLETMLDRLREKHSRLTEEDREWLRKFRKEE